MRKTRIFEWNEQKEADLFIDAVYKGRNKTGGYGDDPLAQNHKMKSWKWLDRLIGLIVWTWKQVSSSIMVIIEKVA